MSEAAKVGTLGGKIAGVPGFNGFASKWSLYVAMILGSQMAPYLALFALVAILTSALTLASFLKFFGMAFLARSSAVVRERAAAGRLEAGALMRLPQIILAGLCILFGLVPALAFGVMSAAMAASAQGLAAAGDHVRHGRQPVRHRRLRQPPANPRVRPLGGAGADPGHDGAFIWFAAYLSRLGGSERRASDAWLCGYAAESESNRYRAHGMYGEFKRYFGWVGGTARDGGHASKGSTS